MEEYGAHAFLKQTTPTLFGKQFKTEHPEVVDKLVNDAEQFSTPACQQYYTAMMNRPDRREVLQHSKVPVLFIAGTEDPAAPLNDMLEQSALPAISYIQVLDGVGHMGMLEAPEKINQYLDEFVSRMAEANAV
jgi:pimeloyl-ACP methyl ester carboxylesterase